MQSTEQPLTACGGVLPAVARNKGISQGILVLCWAPCELAPAAEMLVQSKSRMMLRTPNAQLPPSTKTCQHMMMQVIPREAVAENLQLPVGAGLLD